MCDEGGLGSSSSISEDINVVLYKRGGSFYVTDETRVSRKKHFILVLKRSQAFLFFNAFTAWAHSKTALGIFLDLT